MARLHPFSHELDTLFRMKLYGRRANDSRAFCLRVGCLSGAGETADRRPIADRAEILSFLCPLVIGFSAVGFRFSALCSEARGGSASRFSLPGSRLSDLGSLPARELAEVFPRRPPVLAPSPPSGTGRLPSPGDLPAGLSQHPARSRSAARARTPRTFGNSAQAGAPCRP